MSDLKDRTLFISGGSRGIGLAIAKRAAQDGANIIIAAKTAEPHPKLPGTIYSAAEEIEEAGGKALPVVCDIRDDKAVKAAVAAGAEKFGGIDLCVNNASAISLTPTLQTPMRRFDLMHQINTRGTFLVSQTCLPHLLESDNPHILNLSPPLNMLEKWFRNHVAYTMAKFGMSMCVL
ncbi:MAG: SDR family oxidoreductase, partial [Proteobacteria bacterium]|nr:SDR family oxidoreductase [Pseudomonadota bacterium]